MNPIMRALRAVSRKRGSHHGGRRQRRPLHSRLVYRRGGYSFGPGRHDFDGDGGQPEKPPFIGGFGGQS